MRPLVVLALASALLLPGCFGGDEEEQPPTTSTPGGTPPAGTTPGPGPTPSPTPTPPTTGGNRTNGSTNGTGNTTVKAPKVACIASGTFNAPPPATASAPVDCPIEAGYRKVVLNVTWGGTPPVGQGVQVVLADADGAAVLTCGYENPVPPVEPSAPCMQEGTVAKPGAWKVQFSGAGTVTAEVAVNVS